MSEGLQSILIGTAGLSLAALAALALAVERRPVANRKAELRRLAWLVALGVAVQGLHALEEFVTGFHVRFPELLGLEPWTARFFVSFNLSWLAVWLLAIPAMLSGIRAAYFPLWFLSVGLVLNGVAHPLLALAALGYFPGLLTSPVLGVLGLKLMAALWEVTEES